MSIQTSTRIKSRPYEEFLQEELQDLELAAAYLSIALEEGTPEEFLLALRGVADAHGGIAAIAEAAQLNRQSLYRTLSRNGNPTLTTLTSILHALGLKLTITQASVEDLTLHPQG